MDFTQRALVDGGPGLLQYILSSENNFDRAGEAILGDLDVTAMSTPLLWRHSSVTLCRREAVNKLELLKKEMMRKV